MDSKEFIRYQKLLKIENALSSQGYSCLIGIDEAGRGPLAGPVVAAAVHIPRGIHIPGVNDSKKLSPTLRESIFEKLTHHLDIKYKISVVDHTTIDEINILQATLVAMKDCAENLDIKADYALIDGVSLNLPFKSQKIIKGDSKSYSIAAASILAKVTRDRLMIQFDQKWPEYGFKSHKGYGTKAHREVIEAIGPCEIHRKTFEPVKSWLNKYQPLPL